MMDIEGMTGPMCDWPRIALIEGAEKTLKTLSSSRTCHLATNATDSSETQIRQALERAGIACYIKTIFCTDSLACNKESPNYYSVIQNRLDCPASHIVMIGDSLTTDVKGAISAGLNGIWYNPQHQAVPEGVCAITHLEDLLSE